MYISDLVDSRITLLPELWRIIAEIIKQISGIPTANTSLVPSSKSWNAEVAQLLPLFNSPLWSGPQAETSNRTAVDEKRKPAFDRTYCFRGSHFTWANLYSLSLMIYCHQWRKCLSLLTSIQTPKPLLSPSGYGNAFPSLFLAAPTCRTCARTDPLMKP